MATALNQYTTRAAPIAWRPPESFEARPSGKGELLQFASDVYSLGCTFIEVLTGCEREPFDWLVAADNTGFKLITFRSHDSSREIDPITVRSRIGCS